MSKYDGFIESTFSEGSFDERDNICLECPKCGKKKFYFSREKGCGICFACEYAVNAVKLIMDLKGCTYEQAYMQLCRLVKGKGKSLLIPESKEDAPASVDTTLLNTLFEALSNTHLRVEEGEQLTLPDKCKPATESREAMRYLTDVRGIREEDVTRFDLRYVPRAIPDRLAGHVIFPNFNRKGDLNFWTSRATFEPKFGPKSYNPTGISRKGLLFGVWALRKNLGELFVVEGPMDCVCLGGRAVALLGKVLSSEHLATIQKIRTERIIVALDEDAVVERAKVASQLAAACTARVYMVSGFEGEKDPAGVAQKMKARSRDVASCLKKALVPYTVANELRARITGGLG